MYSQDRFPTAVLDFDRGISPPERPSSPGRIIVVTEQMRKADAELQRARAVRQTDWVFKPSLPARKPARVRPVQPKRPVEAKRVVHEAKACVDCGKSLCRQSSGSRCRQCEGVRRRKPLKNCVGCSRVLSLRNTSGKCRYCKSRIRSCADCGKPLREAVRCLKCYLGRATKPRGACKDCGARLSRYNKSGRCVVCRPKAPISEGGFAESRNALRHLAVAA